MRIIWIFASLTKSNKFDFRLALILNRKWVNDWLSAEYFVAFLFTQNFPILIVNWAFNDLLLRVITIAWPDCVACWNNSVPSNSFSFWTISLPFSIFLSLLYRHFISRFFRDFKSVSRRFEIDFHVSCIKSLTSKISMNSWVLLNEIFVNSTYSKKFWLFVIICEEFKNQWKKLVFIIQNKIIAAFV